MDPCRAIFRAVSGAITHPGLLHAHGADAGLNVPRGQMTMAHDPRPAIFQALARMGVNKTGNLGFNRMSCLTSAPMEQTSGIA